MKNYQKKKFSWKGFIIGGIIGGIMGYLIGELILKGIKLYCG